MRTAESITVIPCIISHFLRVFLFLRILSMIFPLIIYEHRHSRLIYVLVMNRAPRENMKGPSAYVLGEKKAVPLLIWLPHMYAMKHRTVMVNTTTI